MGSLWLGRDQQNDFEQELVFKIPCFEQQAVFENDQCLQNISHLKIFKQALTNFTHDQRELPILSAKESVFESSCAPVLGRR